MQATKSAFQNYKTSHTRAAPSALVQFSKYRRAKIYTMGEVSPTLQLALSTIFKTRFENHLSDKNTQSHFPLPTLAGVQTPPRNAPSYFMQTFYSLNCHREHSLTCHRERSTDCHGERPCASWPSWLLSLRA
jgi:hypothetical protein